MKAFAVFLLFLSISSVFTSTVSLGALEEIRQDELGESFVNLIDLNLRLKTPVDEISTILDGILRALEADHELLIRNYETQRGILNVAITTGISLVDTYQNTVSILTQSEASDQQTLSSTQTSLTNTQTSLTQTETRLTTLQQDYQQYVPNAEADIDDLTLAVASLKKAIERMQAYKNSGVEQRIFLQVSSSLKRDMKQVTDQLEGMEKSLTQANSMYTPIVKELAELTSHMTQDKADKIISLMNQLLQLLQNTLDTLESQIVTYKTTFITQTTTLTQTIKKYRIDVAQYGVDIENLQTRIQQTQSNIVTTNQNLSDAQDKLAADRESLQTLENDFRIQDDRFKRLIPLIKKVIESFNENVVNADSEALEAVNNF